MRKLTDELEGYFNNTPKEVLKQDWDAIRARAGQGVDVLEYIEHKKGVNNQKRAWR